jgi:hypothetical protein
MATGQAGGRGGTLPGRKRTPHRAEPPPEKVPRGAAGPRPQPPECEGEAINSGVGRGAKP